MGWGLGISQKIDEFSEILTYKRAKNSLFECKLEGGGGCRKFEGSVGNLGGFAPPPEKVNFRQCLVWRHGVHVIMS